MSQILVFFTFALIKCLIERVTVTKQYDANMKKYMLKSMKINKLIFTLLPFTTTRFMCD